MPRLYNPPFFKKATPEQERIALEDAKKTLASLRDMLRELDLPATELQLAYHLFSNNVSGQIEEGNRAKHLEHEKKIQATIKERRANAIASGVPVGPIMNPGGLGASIAYDPIEEQVRQELGAYPDD